MYKQKYLDTKQNYLDTRNKSLKLGGAIENLLVEDGMVLVLLNKDYGSFRINEDIIQTFNEQSTIYYGWGDDNIRFEPEFIRRVQKGETISDNKLEVERMPLIAYELDAYKITEYDGYETLEIDESAIDNYKQTLLSEKFFSMMNSILYSDLGEVEIVEYIRMLAPSDLLINKNINFESRLKQLGENCDFIPVFSKSYIEAKASFETTSTR